MPVRTATVRSTAPRLIRAATILALTGALAGCVSNGNSGPSNAFAQVGGGGGPATVAFESIDGPPPQVFDRMVNLLDSESKLRNVAVVSRQAPAVYRVRSYLAAQIRGGRTTIAWVWDVYDRDQQRALRLSGEETAGKAGRDAWAQADDLVLRRIAQAGLTGLSNALNSAATDPAPGAPTRSGPAIAAADDVAPAVSTLSFASAGFSTR
jgi:hypothetical protein